MRLNRRQAFGAAAMGVAAAEITVQIPPRSRSSVLMIVLDDVGFADLGCYGSEVSTPAIDGLATNGVRFTNFHVNALCSPTRASLLTGQNAHAVGLGTISEFARPHPSYEGRLRAGVPTLGDHFRAAGFTTFAVGKWHLNAVSDANLDGRFSDWPTRRGFDRWYGFHGPIADHWHPELFADSSSVALPLDRSDYHLSADLVDQAGAFVADAMVSDPSRPFFLYLALGACHWPLHVPQEDIAAYRGLYDKGWDAVRESRFQRQSDLGLLGSGAALAPRNPGVPNWNDLTSDERRFAARAQEVYAGFLTHADRQIGRLMARLASMGASERLITVVVSDNGASAEGSRIGMADVRRNHYSERETTHDLLDALEALGDDSTFGAYPQGWAQASNTPFKWFKGNIHGGGVRAPLIIHAPGTVPFGETRRQFHHAIDIAPTLIELAGCEPILALAGGQAEPMHGVSIAYALSDPSAPSRRLSQSWESSGNRGVFAEGWKAVARHTPGGRFEDDPWELYHLNIDPSEVQDRAAEEPARLTTLRRIWDLEAARYGMGPLDDRNTFWFSQNLAPGRSRYRFYPGAARLDRLSAPNIFDRSFRLEALIDVEEESEGVLLASGTSVAGYELFLIGGRPHFVYVFSRTRRQQIVSPVALVAGRRTVTVGFERTGSQQGLAHLAIDGERLSEAEILRQWPIYAASAGVRCGANHGSPISRLYAGAFPFTGGIVDMSIELL